MRQFPIVIIEDKIIKHLQFWEVKEYAEKGHTFFWDNSGNLIKIDQNELNEIIKIPKVNHIGIET